MIGASSMVAAATALTVYSSLPLSGTASQQANAVNAGARLALQEAGGQAGGRPVRLVALDDATRRAGSWTPEATSANGLRAARDESTIAYIGELNSGATAISLPILNEAGIPMISPSNTFIGLTRDFWGASRGEPDQYYTVAERTYFRLAPNDAVQGMALATAMRDRGCRRTASLTDGERYGAGLGATVREWLRRFRVPVVHARRVDPRFANYRALAGRLRALAVDCVVYAGVTANAVQLFKDLASALPQAQLFAGDGVAERAFTDGDNGGIPPAVGRRVLISVATLAPEAYPPAGQAVITGGDPYRAHGYEAMRLILDGLDAGAADRAGLVTFLRGVRNRTSVLGTYSFDAYGDTSLRTYGLYTVRAGELAWVGTVNAGY